MMLMSSLSLPKVSCASGRRQGQRVHGQMAKELVHELHADVMLRKKKRGKKMLLLQPVVADCALCERQEGKGSGFTDNDSLAKELAHELRADLLVLLTNVDGLLDGPPGARGSKCAQREASATGVAASCLRMALSSTAGSFNTFD